MSDRPTYCWDTNVFLAWLSEESTAPLADIDLVRGEIDRGEANLLVSVGSLASRPVSSSLI